MTEEDRPPGTVKTASGHWTPIHLCPTCGQRVATEDDGSYRPIAELQLSSTRYYERQLYRKLVTVFEMSRLLPRRDYKEVVRAIHKRMAPHVQRWAYLLHAEEEDDGEDQEV